MKSLLSLALAAFLAGAAAHADNVMFMQFNGNDLASADSASKGRDTALYGEWIGPSYDIGGGMTVTPSGIFSEASAGMSATCTKDGNSATASVSVDYSVENGQIHILADAQQSVETNGIQCQVGIEKSTVSYTISGNLLILTMDGQTLVLTKK